MPSTRPMISGRLANRKRSWNGKLNTHCRIGNRGSTSSTSKAALSAIRRAPQLGQKPALVATVAGWVQRQGLASLTLTTFRHLAWNAPFYRSLGFEEISPEEWQPEFRARVERETARMDPQKRIAMQLSPPIPR